MKTILKTTIVSITVSAYILTFTGCIEDRTNFSDLETKSVVVIDPDGDPDNDGLTNQEEVDLGTDPDDADSDDDGLDDGLEVKITGTSPLASDSDGDGVTDGIEVLGTDIDNINSSGKVITAGENKTPLKEGKNGLKVLDINKPISIEDWGDKATANTNTNPFTDPQDKIDALDPMNDSDYDKRQNENEKMKSTNPLDKESYYPWIYETPVGKIMENAGFVYIPGGFDLDGGGDESGFWMAKYEARGDSPTNIQGGNLQNIINRYFDPDTIHYTQDPAPTSGEKLFIPIYDNKDGDSLSGMRPYEMAELVSTNQIIDSTDTNTTLGEPIMLPTNKQYAHVLKLISKYKTDQIKNSILAYDENVEEDYRRDIKEINSGKREVTRDLVRLVDLKNYPSWWDVDGIQRSDKNKAAAGQNVFASQNNGEGMEQDDYAVIIRDGKKLDLRYGPSYAEKSYNGFRAASDYLAK